MNEELVISMLTECLDGEMEPFVRSNIQRSIGILEQMVEDAPEDDG